MADDLDNAMAVLWSRKPDEVAAFEKAYPVLRSTLCAFAHRRLSNETWSEDAAQDSLLALWRVWSANPTYFKSADHLRNYLFQTAVWKIEDIRRRSKRYVQVDGASVLERLEELLAAGTEDVGHTAEERRRLIADALASLPADQRIALEHHILGGRDGKEAAAQIGIGHSALRKRVSRGLGQLRDWFAKRGTS